MSERYIKTYKYLNYVEHLLILVSTSTGYVSISAFTLLVTIPVCTTSSSVGIKMCAISAGIKRISHLSRRRRKSMIKQYY